MTLKIEAKGITKSFQIGRGQIEVLKGVDLALETGSWTALLGASGSGKTTLLDILGTLSRPNAGTLFVDGEDLLKLGHLQLVSFRRRRIGFVFQAYHMLPELSILENAMIPAMLNHASRKECRERATDLLERVGLGHRLKHRPNELSGGEQQRAAIARSLINAPDILLADEPTGNLDSVTGAGILKLLQEIHSHGATTIAMVTHDRNVASLASRIIELKDGVVAS